MRSMQQVPVLARSKLALFVPAFQRLLVLCLLSAPRFSIVFATSMALDSKAVFEERLQMFGIHDLKPELETRGWDTLGAFAFCCSLPPNSAGDMFWTEVAGPLLKDDRSSPRLPGLRRLYFEAWTSMTADMKNRMERREDDVPVKVPAAEREERRVRVQTRLGEGVLIEGRMEPSDSLVNLCAQIVEDNTIRHVPWEKCTYRDLEVQGARRVERFAVDRNGVLKLASDTKSIELPARDILEVSQVFTRRGLCRSRFIVCSTMRS